jgi:hypothetical protein
MGQHNLAPMQRVINQSIPEPNSGCWLWLGTTNGRYPQLKIKRKNIYAHRIACESVYGDIGDLQALHKCDNPLCVNPDHLYPGTQLQNVKDCIDRGRFKSPGPINPEKGSDRYNAKLTEADALYIRNSSEKGIDLVKKFGVSKTTVSKLRNGKIWSHI